MKVKPFYSSKDIAQLLNLSMSTVYDYNKTGYLGFPKGFKIGDKWRWLPGEVDAWIDLQRGELETDNIKESSKVKAFVAVADTPDKFTRLISHAPDMYDLLTRIIDPDDVCPNKEIRELLYIINNGAND